MFGVGHLSDAKKLAATLKALRSTNCYVGLFMKKLKFLFFGFGIIIIGLACNEKTKKNDLLNGTEQIINKDALEKEARAKTEIENQELKKHVSLDLPISDPVTDPGLNPQPNLDMPTNPDKTIDPKILDARLIKDAIAKNIDPKKHRIPVRENPDMSKVYRELGMFVIVGPLGDTVYLPEEI